MTNPVAIGDDGRSVQPSEDGPLLRALREHFDKMRVDYRNALEENRLRVRQAVAMAQPAYAPQFASGAVDSSGNLVLDLGGPQLGRRWVVRMATFSDAVSFWNTMGSAQATLCVGRRTGNTVYPSMVRWPFNTAPNAATFGSDQMWITPQDHVLLSVTGGTSAQNIQATIWIQDFSLESTPFAGEQV